MKHPLSSDMGIWFLFYVAVMYLSVFVVAAGSTRDIVINCSSIQSLYQFGASKYDTGNSIRLLPTTPAAGLPYGETFPGTPTGRWSDGRLIIDFEAMTFGLPLLNPYLNRNASFSNGVNFAVAGATALNSSFFLQKGVIVSPATPSLSVQLRWFKTYLASICNTPTECADRLRRAIVFLGEIGSNDITYSLNQGKSLEEIKTYVPSIVQAIVNATREVIVAGAIRVVVSGNYPIGCFPNFLISAVPSNDSTAYDDLGCWKSANNLAIFENNYLQKALRSLKIEFPDVTILYSDYYNAFRSVLRKAPIFGFDSRKLLKACCGSEGQYEYDSASPGFCGNPGSSVCPNPNQYIHWDGIHLTQEANNRVSQIIIKNVLLKIGCCKDCLNWVVGWLELGGWQFNAANHPRQFD